jgi:hypothetical protein
VSDSSVRTKGEICADLESLVQETGFLYSLLVMLRHDLFFDPREAADVDWRSRLSYQEFTFLAGLLVKRPLDLTHPTEDEMQNQIRRTYMLFEELHEAHGGLIMERMADALERAQREGLSFEATTQALFGAGEVMTEPIFYSGSGAYDFQYWTLAPRRYELDQEWLRTNRGLDMDVAASITRSIKSLLSPFLDEPPNSFDAACDAALEMFCISPDEIDDHDPEEVLAYFSAFSLKPGTANESLTEPGQYNRVDSHPLIALDDGRFFVPVHFNLARSLYESPYYWMLADSGYRNDASSNRGESTEALTAEMLSRVFGESNVFRGVELRRGSTVVGEIDVLASVGRKGLIVQCKSKRLTELARRGDTEQLETDFADAVQAAYEQGVSCRELLRDSTVTAFKEDGEAIRIDFDDAFIACVVSDHYPSLTHQVHAYLQRDANQPYPIALSIFDLEIVCYYLSDPFEFMYYVRQRIDLAEYYRADEEMSLLAYHLKMKLFRVPGPDMVSVTSDMAQLIDANYPAARGERPKTQASSRLFHEWKNEQYDRLVEDLKRSGDPHFVDAVFMLFDFSGDSMDALVEGMLSAKETSQADGKEHSLATLAEETNAGISFVTRPDDPNALADKTFLYAQLKKYQTRATEWLGLGSIATGERLADVVVYNRETWKPDPELEKRVEQLLGGGTAKRLTKKIGRNEPCYCGSGLKFKRCHGR